MNYDDPMYPWLGSHNDHLQDVVSTNRKKETKTVNKDLKARVIDRVFYVVLFAIAFVVLWVLLEIFAPVAQAAELRVRVTPGVPTVSGIEAAPSPAPFYGRQVRVNSGPSAGIYDVEPAPPNNCVPPAFEVISGLPTARGCYGAR
jgi:hypothetical protein